VDDSSILFSCERESSAPFITGDTFRAYADHVYDEVTYEFHPENVKAGDLIFVKADGEYLEVFFKRYHHQIAHPYILLTHNSDQSAPGAYREFLEDSKLLAWFAQNVEGEAHPKLHPIPIGIANKYWEHGNTDVFSSYLTPASHQNRPYLCCISFRTSTYPQERTHVWNLFANQPWCIVSIPRKLDDYLQDLSQSKFVISPRGNGLDCHRTWEALLMGSIPIVRSSSLDTLFSDLPVLIVKDWTMISESYLHEQYMLIKQKPFNRAKLFIDYWLTSIRRAGSSIP
jgi:hypothetical protein